MNNWYIRLLDTIDELQQVEELQRKVWPGSETDVVPVHLLTTAVHNGGLVIGGFYPAEPGTELDQLAGFVFGFPGLYTTPDGPRLKHCSHMLAVHPDYRGRGLGFALKRAQWQIVRHQGIDRITWTYDSLLSRNAYLNIARLGSVCNTYLQEVYGEMRDELNIGVPSDRFEVDWWVNSQRVSRRLSRKARIRLDLAHFFSAGAEIINPTQIDQGGMSIPPSTIDFPSRNDREDFESMIVLVEIPADYQALKTVNHDLAIDWRLHTRRIFERLFDDGYLVTDFIHIPGANPRSYYVLSHGDGTL